MTRSVDVVIVGGGVVGAATAWHLSRMGAGRVLLLELDQLASGGTGRSTAIVRTHYVHRLLAAMALEARLAFERFSEEVGGDCGFHRTGFLALHGPADRDSVEANVAMHRELGIEASVLGPDELGQIDRRISGAGVGVAAWEPGSGRADPHGTTAGYAAAARRGGVEIHVGSPVVRILHDGASVTGVETATERFAAGAVLIAAGPGTPPLVQPLGFEVPLTAIRHPIATVHRSGGFGSPHPTVSDRVLGSYYMPEGSELTVIGTTAASEGEHESEPWAVRQPAPADLELLAGRFLERFPGEEGARLQGGWTGVYDCSPDLQPLLGALPDLKGVFIACGFSGHGFKLSPVVGRLLAERILLGRTEGFDLDFFSPSRFNEGRPITTATSYTVPTLG